MVKLGWRTALRIGIDLKPRLFRVQTLSRSPAGNATCAACRVTYHTLCNSQGTLSGPFFIGDSHPMAKQRPPELAAPLSVVFGIPRGGKMPVGARFSAADT